MSVKVVIPQMGESVLEGTITRWLKKVGDKVSRDEPLFEITTDKVDSEIPSPAAGVLAEILAPEGKTVQVSTVVAVIEEETALAALLVEEPEAPVGEVVDIARVKEQPAEAPTAEISIEKPTVETGEKAAAVEVISEPVVEAEGRPVPEKEAPTPAKETEKAGPPTAVPMVVARDVRTSPLVRRLAREYEIDLSAVKGTGLEGRITKQDILKYMEKRGEPAVIAPEGATPPAPSAEPAQETPKVLEPMALQKMPSARPEVVEVTPPPPETPGLAVPTETVPMTPMRKATAEHMVASRRTSAHVSTIFEADMSAITGVRDRHKEEFEKREGIKLTYTPFLVKALVDTVQEFPVFNSSVSGDSIVYKKPVNVGIAVALEGGLIVPVVKDAHLKSFTGLVLAIHDLAERARTKRLKPDDVQNGTITVTNPGVYGSLFFTPIINQPQVAILGVGTIQKRVMVINGAIAIRPMVYLSLSFDHRVIDGVVADQFMARLKSRIESWTQWVE